MVTPLAGAVAPSGSKVAWAPCLTHLQLVEGIPPRPDCQVSARLTECPLDDGVYAPERSGTVGGRSVACPPRAPAGRLRP